MGGNSGLLGYPRFLGEQEHTRTFPRCRYLSVNVLLILPYYFLLSPPPPTYFLPPPPPPPFPSRLYIQPGTYYHSPQNHIHYTPLPPQTNGTNLPNPHPPLRRNLRRAPSPNNDGDEYPPMRDSRHSCPNRNFPPPILPLFPIPPRNFDHHCHYHDPHPRHRQGRLRKTSHSQIRTTASTLRLEPPHPLHELGLHRRTVPVQVVPVPLPEVSNLR